MAAPYYGLISPPYPIKAGWQNLDFEDGHRELRPTVRRVMKAVYRHLDPAHEPHDMDNWWHSPKVRYQIDIEDPSKPEIVIINILEGREDQPAMDNHFTVNLNTNRIHDKFKDIRFPAPEEILGDLEDIKRRVIDVLEDVDRRRRAHGRKFITENYQLISRELRRRSEEGRDIVKEGAYYRRLLENGRLFSEDFAEYLNKDLDWGGTCPACFNPEDGEGGELAPCVGCDLIGCKALWCDGHDIDGIERCLENEREVYYCRACRVNRGISSQPESDSEDEYEDSYDLL